jgi:ABC-type sugar transport system permease subunit
MTKHIKKMQTKNAKDLVFYCGMLALPMLQLLIFYFFVNFNSILLAFKSYQEGVYVSVGFDNFTNLFRQLSADALLKTAFKNSFTAYALSLLISLPVSLFISFYIYKKKANGFKTLVFLPAIIPVVVLTRIFWQVSDSILPSIARKFSETSEFRGLLNDTNVAFLTVTLYSIITGFGPSVLIFVGSMSNISESVVESAQLDGVTPIKEFWYITLPYIYPVIRL